MIGRIVSHYRVIEQIGAGGMGVVFRAEDIRLGRSVALKFLPLEVSADALAVERFEREARTASSLNHPNICTIHDIGEFEGHRFIAMEYLDGQPLDRQIGGKPLPMRMLLDLGIQIADALDVAHTQRILHRDIKPANIFVTRRGHAKVLDFGLAKLARGTRALMAGGGADSTIAIGPATSGGMAVGTIAYMSPEQARGEELDLRSDLFSYGVVLHEMASGRQAFSGNTAATVFDALLNRMPVSVAALNPEVPPELERIIDKALDKERELRYQTAADLRSDLQRLKRQRESGGIAASMSATPSRSGAWPAATRPPSGAQQPPSGVGRPPSGAERPPVFDSQDDVPTIIRPMRSPLADAPQASAAAASAAAAPIAAAPSAAAAIPAAPAPAPAIPAAGPAARTPRRLRVLAGVGALGLVAVVVGSGVFFLRAGDASTDAAANAAPRPPGADFELQPELNAAGVDASATDVAAPEGTSAGLGDSGAVAAAPDTTASTSASPTARRTPARVAAPPPAPPTATPPPVAPAPVATTPDPVALAVNGAQPAIAAGRYDEALTSLRAALTERSDSGSAPQAALLIARIHDRRNQTDAALTAYEDVRNRYPQSAAAGDALLRMAALVQQTRRSDRIALAQGYLTQAAHGFPDTPTAPRALLMRGLIEERERLRVNDPELGRVVPAALVTYRQLAQRYPANEAAGGALVKLGRYYDDLKRYDLQAAALMELGTRFPATRHDAFWEAGELYEKRLKDPAKARDAYSKVPTSSRRYEDAQRKLR